jgi:hypothetical protein
MQLQELQTVCLKIARYIDPSRMEWREAELADSDRRIKAWWRGLTAHSRREWRNASRSRGGLKQILHR